jgi:Fic family protein
VAKAHRPPFTISPAVLTTAGEIMRLVGQYEGISEPPPAPTLRRQNRIRTVVGSLAIEGNTLTLDQVTALLGDKRVAGSKREIMEVTNAIAAYEAAPSFVPTAERDLLRAHKIMMSGLARDAGRYRKRGVGIFRGSERAHMAPPASRVPDLIGQLLAFLRTDATPALVKSAVVHYELEFIHPFSDGNGRLGRLWQHVILLREHPVFELVPVESVIHARQASYYRVLGECDAAGDSTRFIEFALTALHDGLSELVSTLRPAPLTGESRLEIVASHFGHNEFSRKDYLAYFKRISTATASRDLRDGVASGRLARTGDRALARYRFR